MLCQAGSSGWLYAAEERTSTSRCQNFTGLHRQELTSNTAEVRVYCPSSSAPRLTDKVGIFPFNRIAFPSFRPRNRTLSYSRDIFRIEAWMDFTWSCDTGNLISMKKTIGCIRLGAAPTMQCSLEFSLIWPACGRDIKAVDQSRPQYVNIDNLP